MKKLLIFTLILTLAASTVAFAQQRPLAPGNCDGPGKQGRHHGMSMRDGAPGLKVILAHGDKINLTDDQRETLENMKTDFQMQRVDQKAELEKAKIKLKALMRDEAGESDVNAAIDNVSKLKANMQKTRYAHAQKVKSVLTEDQVNKLKQLRKECSPDGGEGMKAPGCKPGCRPGGGTGPGGNKG